MEGKAFNVISAPLFIWIKEEQNKTEYDTKERGGDWREGEEFKFLGRYNILIA